MTKLIRFIGRTRRVWTNGMTFERDVATAVPTALADRLLLSADFELVTPAAPEPVALAPVDAAPEPQDPTHPDDVSSGADLLVLTNDLN